MIGRPPKKPEERLSENMPFRVTKDEKDRVIRQALHEGLSLNQFLRKHLAHLLSVETKVVRP